MALGIGNYNVVGTLERRATVGGNVLIEAKGRARLVSDSTAGAEGAPGDEEAGSPNETDPNGNVDSQVQGERDQANTQSMSNGGSGTGGSMTPSASSSSGPVTVAAAIAITLNTSTFASSIAARRTRNLFT